MFEEERAPNGAKNAFEENLNSVKKTGNVWRQCSSEVGQSLTCTQPDWQWVGLAEERMRRIRNALVSLKVAAIAAKCTFWCWATLTLCAVALSCKLCPRVSKSKSWSKKISMGCNWDAPQRSLHSLSSSIFTRPTTILGPYWQSAQTQKCLKCQMLQYFQVLSSGSLRGGFQISEQAFQPPGLDSCAETKPSGQNFPHLSFSAITTPEQNKPEHFSFDAIFFQLLAGAMQASWLCPSRLSGAQAAWYFLVTDRKQTRQF